MIALIFAGDLKYCPYISRYLARLECYKCEYEVLFWNRSVSNLSLSDNYRYFDSYSNLASHKAKKTIDFLAFRNWLRLCLEGGKYDGFIVLSTLTGVLIYNELQKFSKRYIFDIRDYSYEGNIIYYCIEKELIRNSYFTAISSAGFKKFLPDNEYIIAHNFNRNDIVNDTVFRQKELPIKFVWNGVMRYFDFQKQYIDALRNDSRFLMVYHGDGPELEKYKKYCESRGVKNIVFTGAYDNSRKAEILSDASILNNCYGYVVNAGNKVKYAVSNRFYDGIIFRIPQLVDPDGYKTMWAQKSGIGISIEVGQNFADELYVYYMSINNESFNLNCERILELVIEEDNKYIRKIDEFISYVKNGK